MQARAHLKLIVSEPPTEPVEVVPERLSMIQPVSSLRVRLHWLRVNAVVVGLWSASAVLLSIAGALLVARL